MLQTENKTVINPHGNQHTKRYIQGQSTTIAMDIEQVLSN